MDQLIAVINHIMLAFNTHTHSVATAPGLTVTPVPNMNVSVTP
jgi:hypothetical protein